MCALETVKVSPHMAASNGIKLDPGGNLTRLSTGAAGVYLGTGFYTVKRSLAVSGFGVKAQSRRGFDLDPTWAVVG